MLSLLPQLFFLSPLTYALLRGALAALFVLGIKEQWAASQGVLARLTIGIEALAALGLAIGLYTQGAAIATFCVLLLWIVRPALRPYPLSTILLALAIAIAVAIGGAGAFAFDLPI